jgi:hypothetical protein
MQRFKIGIRPVKDMTEKINPVVPAGPAVPAVPAVYVCF